MAKAKTDKTIKAKTGNAKPETKTGRPPKEFDLSRVEDFGYFRATYETMAHLLGCSVETIKNRMEDQKSGFYLAYKKGLANMVYRLSEAQVNTALSGNATLLIWLGKQYLGQSDTPQTSDDNRGIEFDGFHTPDSE